MKSTFLCMGLLLTYIMWTADLSMAVCPEEPNDNGACDTLYVEVHPTDGLFTGAGHLVQVPIRITHDVLELLSDSLEYLYIPLCYTHTNPSKYCSLSGYWNNNNLYGEAGLEHSVFRHFEGETNVIMEMSERCPMMALCWWEIDLDGVSHVGLPLNNGFFCVKCGFLGDLSRSLLATLTFRVEDTMTVCIDTCYLPSTGHLAFQTFSISEPVSFVPRDNMPYCFSIFPPAVGDVNADGVIDLGDVLHLISYLYKNGPPPNFFEAGDTDCNGNIDLGVCLISSAIFIRADQSHPVKHIDNKTFGMFFVLARLKSGFIMVMPASFFMNAKRISLDKRECLI